MPARNHDLHGNAPDSCDAALLLVDVINDLEFPGGRELLPSALRAAKKIAALKARAREAGVPVIYANDNFGRWRSNFNDVVDHCLTDGVRGEPIARLLAPDAEDYFVLKPKHSAFYSTTLDLLLKHLGAKAVVVTGLAGNICVLFTANDAYLRDLRVVVPADCTASNTEADNRAALDLMRKLLKADTRPSSEWTFEELAADGNADQPAASRH